MPHYCEFCQVEHSSASCFAPGRAQLTALRAEVEELTLRRSETIAMCDQLRAENDTLAAHHAETRLALGLVGMESRPHAAYIADLKAEIEALKGGALHDVLVSQEQTIVLMQDEIAKLRRERADDQLHTDNIELRAENERLRRERSDGRMV